MPLHPLLAAQADVSRAAWRLRCLFILFSNEGRRASAASASRLYGGRGGVAFLPAPMACQAAVTAAGAGALDQLPLLGWLRLLRAASLTRFVDETAAARVFSSALVFGTSELPWTAYLDALSLLARAVAPRQSQGSPSAFYEFFVSEWLDPLFETIFEPSVRIFDGDKGGTAGLLTPLADAAKSLQLPPYTHAALDSPPPPWHTDEIPRSRALSHIMLSSRGLRPMDPKTSAAAACVRAGLTLACHRARSGPAVRSLDAVWSSRSQRSLSASHTRRSVGGKRRDTAADACEDSAETRQLPASYLSFTYHTHAAHQAARYDRIEPGKELDVIRK